MKRFPFIYLLLAGNAIATGAELQDTPILGCNNNPRLLIKDTISVSCHYPVSQNHSVFLYQEDTAELYVGGTDIVQKYVFNPNVGECCNAEKYPLKPTSQQQCGEGPCLNVITVMEMFQDSLFVCGTNGQRPQCWKIFPSVNNRSHEIVESFEGTGISPYVHTQNSLSLTVDGDLYAAAPLDADGSSLQFRRKAGSRTHVWMYDNWVLEPTFISASWVKREHDPDNEKIYIFFREKNSDQSPEADPWISRVARVCKLDKGGSKKFFQNMWTSFLKARLVCGFPEESVYFNRLQDIYVVHAENWRDTRIYGLFTSSWNSTAVCIYSVEMMEEIFQNSTFKGYDKDIPSPRPGTCVRNSRSLPRATVSVVKDYPEMTDWVHSLHYMAPFYVSNNNYTKIAVDQVQAADQRTYNILLLATDSGKIHKVLESGSEAFILSETQLSSNSSVQTIKLDSKKKKLIVGFSEKIFTLDLQRCEEYNESCAQCVLSRDPYCAWTNSKCAPTVHGGIQNILNGKTNVCSEEKKPAIRTKRETVFHHETAHSVPQGVPFYLSCPIDSYHAVYTWEHGGRSSPCQQMHSDCLHLIPQVVHESYGNYDCVSRERDYTKVVKTYQLREPIISNVEKDTKRNSNGYKNNASGPVPQILWILLPAVAVWGIFR